jgi:hypothetical protein
MLVDRIFSFALAMPPLITAIAAWFLLLRQNSLAIPHLSGWRKRATTAGLVFLTLHVFLSYGYLLYELLARTIEWSVFDKCSSAGAIACLIGLLGAAVGRGVALRLLLVLGSLAGMLFWYLTIAPRPETHFVVP